MALNMKQIKGINGVCVIVNKVFVNIADRVLMADRIKTVLILIAANRKTIDANWRAAVYSTVGQCYPCHYFEPLAIGNKMAEKSLSIDFSDSLELMDNTCRRYVILPVCLTCYGSNFASAGDISFKDKNISNLSMVIRSC